MIAARVRSRAGSTSTAVEIRRRISPWTARSDCSAAWRALAVRSAAVRTAVTIRSVTGRSAASSDDRGAGCPPVVQREVRRDPGQSFVDDRHDDGRLEAEGAELARPGQERRGPPALVPSASRRPGSDSRQAVTTASPTVPGRSECTTATGSAPRKEAAAAPVMRWASWRMARRSPARSLPLWTGSRRCARSRIRPMRGASEPPGPSARCRRRTSARSAVSWSSRGANGLTR